VQLQTGQFLNAQRTLEGTLRDAGISEARKQPLRETLARLHLALNQVEECSTQLTVLESHDVEREGIPAYVARWAGITRARLLVRQGALEKALEHLISLERGNSHSAQDRRFAAAIHLCAARLLASMRRRSDAAQRMHRAADSDVVRHRDLHGEYYFSWSST